MRHTNFQSACFVKGHPPDPPKVGTHTFFQCDVKREAPKTQFSKQKVDFSTAKTTRESASTNSRLRRLIRLSSSKRLMCLPAKNR